MSISLTQERDTRTGLAIILQIAMLSLSSLVAAADTQGPMPEGYDSFEDRSDILYVWNEAETSQEMANAAIERGDAVFEQVASILGDDRLPRQQLVVVLDGPMFSDNGRNIPRVDAQGRILLYSAFSPMNEYMSMFAHELVHAIRFQGHLGGDAASVLGTGFFEEAYAEAVALIAETRYDRYPYWGTSPVAISSYLIEQDRYLPFQQLIQNHAELSLKCEVQSYPTRGDFFIYLESILGRDAFLAMGDDQGTQDQEFYERWSGQSFSELVAGWQRSVQDRSRASNNAVAQAGVLIILCQFFNLQHNAVWRIDYDRTIRFQ